MTSDRLTAAERHAMAERLRAARYQADRTVRGLAASLDVNPNSITAWERGTLPSPENRAKLAAIYGIDEGVLFAEIAAAHAVAAELLRPSMTADAISDAIGRAVVDALTDRLPQVVDRLAEIGGPRAYSVREVADRLDLSESYVRNLINAGHLATVPHLNPLRVAASALDEFLAGKR